MSIKPILRNKNCVAYFDGSCYPDCPEKKEIIEMIRDFKEKISEKVKNLEGLTKKIQANCSCPLEDRIELIPTDWEFILNPEFRCRLCKKIHRG
ncbi:MAG: hypothetical protein V1851_03145 [Patescibacteria group bacterium]